MNSIGAHLLIWGFCTTYLHRGAMCEGKLQTETSLFSKGGGKKRKES